MNRFRVNLHPALFNVEKSSGKVETKKQREEREALEALNKTKEELGNLESNVFEQLNEWRAADVWNQIFRDRSSNPDFYNVAREEASRFQSRINEKQASWDKNMQDGYKRLLNALIKHNYFSTTVWKFRWKEVEKIRKKYLKCIRKQYEKNVWRADDDKFEEVKDTLFLEGSKTDPARDVYYELTWANINAWEFERKEGYDVTHNDAEKVSEEGRKNSEKLRKQKNFLWSDLPNYLWEIKNTNRWLKALNRLPFVASSVNKPSDRDKKQIKNFVDLAADISEITNKKNPEIVLLDLFSRANDSRTKSEWERAAKNEGIDITKKSQLNDIIDAWKFYLESQRVGNSPKNQHAIYLSIMTIIKKAWSCEAAMKQFYDQVEEYNKKENKKERKEAMSWDKLKENNPKLYNLATELWQKVWVKKVNYTRASNLDKKKIDENTSPVDVLADLNNDGALDFKDDGTTKTWLQFKEAVRNVWEENALNNLIEHAKLVNKTLKNKLKEEDITIDNVKGWKNKEVILLLQDVIDNPGEDLYTLLNGEWTKISEKYTLSEKEKQDLEKKCLAAADKMISEKSINLENLDKNSLSEIGTTEGLRMAVAGALYTEYARVWAGWKISFDEWVKWLSLNGWVQMADNWTTSLCFTVSYNRSFDLKNWWEISAWTHAWIINFARFTTWVDVEVAKKWVTNNCVEHKLWLNIWFSNIVKTGEVFHVTIWHSVDMVNWIESKLPQVESDFKQHVTIPLISKISDSLPDGKLLNLDNQDVFTNVKNSIQTVINELFDKKYKTPLKAEDKTAMVNNVLRLLLNHNWKNLSTNEIKVSIANDMAKQFALAWRERKLASRDDFKWWHYSWVDIGVWLSEWLLTLYTWWHMSLDKVDGYGDKDSDKYVREIPEHLKNKEKWDEEMIAAFNEELGLKDSSKLKISTVKNDEHWMVIIPKETMRWVNVKINESMKWFIKKDANWNVLLDPHTYISWPSIKMGTSSVSKHFSIWTWEGKSVDLRNVTEDWFTTGNINPDKLPWREVKLDKETLNGLLDRLKASINDGSLNKYTFDDNKITELSTRLKPILDKEWGKWKIILKKDDKWNINSEVQDVSDREWQRLQIEYVVEKKAEMMNKSAEEVAKIAYTEANKVTSYALRNVCHADGGNKELYAMYLKFAKAMKATQTSLDYDSAKKAISELLPKMDDYINKLDGRKDSNFKSIVQKLDNLKWADLWQALMSINNIFARVRGVVWAWVVWAWIDKDVKHVKHVYKFNEKWTQTLWARIEERAGAYWIKNRINKAMQDKSMDEEVWNAYINLIDKSEVYRKDNATEASSLTKATTKTLTNAVGINLWNAVNPENMLFNPEIYEGEWLSYPVSELNLGDAQKVLHENALTRFVTNKALISPILVNLWFNDEDIKNLAPKYNGETWKIKLDIWGKKVILGAELKFWYYGQCVNHMLILDNVHAEVEGGSVVDYKSAITKDGDITDANKWTIMARYGVWMWFAARVSGREENNVQEKPELEVWSINGNNGLNEPGDPNTQPWHTSLGNNWSGSGNNWLNDKSSGGGNENNGTPPPDSDF